MGVTASDIITYVGVPLAVIGVLPTMYTFLNALLTLRHIRRRLAENNVVAITRSGLLSGIIEVETPRKSITPLDRTEETYFKLARRSSTLKGGSYTLFNWRELSIGTKTYRLAYHDELVQPQAEVDFEQLVAFLLDRGAVPSQPGFSDLRTSGLWTPTGTKLLLSPVSHDAVLSIAPSDDSDGILSLCLQWKSDWDKRTVYDLPPYWTRIHPPVELLKEDEKKQEAEGSKGKEDISVEVKEISRASTVVEKVMENVEEESQMLIEVISPTTANEKSKTKRGSIRLRIGSFGVEEAYYEDSVMTQLRCRHLKLHRNEPNPIAVWFSSAATALRAHEGGLWAFAIPEDVVHLARRDVIPCGTMVLMDFLTDNDVPAWRTPRDDSMEQFEKMQKLMENSRAMAEEMRLPPEEQRKAREARMKKQMYDFQYENQKKRLEEEKRREEEAKEALISQKLHTGRVAEACRKWLEKENHVGEGLSVALVAEKALWDMIIDDEFANGIAEMLENWTGWADSGGMTKSQFEELKKHKARFAYAACLLAVIKDASNATTGDLVTDMRESLRMWKKVRLG